MITLTQLMNPATGCTTLAIDVDLRHLLHLPPSIVDGVVEALQGEMPMSERLAKLALVVEVLERHGAIRNVQQPGPEPVFVPLDPAPAAPASSTPGVPAPANDDQSFFQRFVKGD